MSVSSSLHATGSHSPVHITCDAVGRLMEFWGFSRHTGRVWTLLYLAPEPLAAAEIQEQLGLSAGSVSMVLRELLRWGVVKKLWLPGQRRDFHMAETDVWKMISRVIAQRESRLLGEAKESLDRAMHELEESSKAGPPEQELAEFRKSRIDELRELFESAEGLLRLLMETQQVDVSDLNRDLSDAGSSESEDGKSGVED